ncbi:hypothetical protein J6590_051395 [Homalodisca vitripennis]|nr:hypothetical protein J6590_051395 [Homalodisca vitripennis]
MAQCSGYNGYRKITRSTILFASSPPARPLVMVRKSPLSRLFRVCNNKFWPAAMNNIGCGDILMNTNPSKSLLCVNIKDGFFLLTEEHNARQPRTNLPYPPPPTHLPFLLCIHTVSVSFLVPHPPATLARRSCLSHRSALSCVPDETMRLPLHLNISVSDVFSSSTFFGSLLIPGVKSETASDTRHCHKRKACRLWNALPDDIRCIEDRARFGAGVRGLLLGGLWGDGWCCLLRSCGQSKEPPLGNSVTLITAMGRLTMTVHHRYGFGNGPGPGGREKSTNHQPPAGSLNHIASLR